MLMSLCLHLVSKALIIIIILTVISLSGFLTSFWESWKYLHWSVSVSWQIAQMSSTHYTGLLIKIWMITGHRGNMCKSMQKQIHCRCTYFTSLRTYITIISIYKYISTNVMDFHDSARNTSMQYLANIIRFYSLRFFRTKMV